MIMTNELIIGLSTAAVGIITGLLGLRGKKQETSATSLTAMMEKQGDRIDKLWARLDAVERDLRETRRELTEEQEVGHTLRRVLADAYAWLLEWSAWAAADRKQAPPSPDLTGIEDALRQPHARNPPE